MADKKFNIVFSGKLVEGSNPPDVLNKLSVLLQLEGAQVRELFKSGAGAIIRKELDGGTAHTLIEKLRDAGAICTAKEIAPPPAPEAPFSGMQPITPPSRSEQRQRLQNLKHILQPPAIPQQQGSGIVSLVFKIILLIAVAGGGWWAYNRTTSNTVTEATPMKAPVAASPQPATQEPAYDNAQDYARKYVGFAGIVEGRLEKPGLILKFDNRGDRDISNLSVQITGYKEFYVLDTSKAQGTEYTVEPEVKSFPAKKVTETVLYFPPGVLSIARKITVSDARF